MIQLSQEQLYELSFEHSASGKTIIDSEGNFKKVNQSFCQMIGYSESELLAMNSASITPENCCKDEKSEILKLIQNETAFSRYTTQRITKHGELVDLVVTATSIHTEKEGKHITYILKEVEKLLDSDHLRVEMKRKQFFLEKILNEMPAQIYFKDLKSRFLLVNNSMLKLFGVERMEDLLGKSDNDFFAGEHAKQAYEDEQEIIRTGNEMVQVEKEVWPNGKVTWVHTTKKPLYDESNKLIGTFGISKDITESKRSEKALEDAHSELERKNKELHVTLENLKEAQSQLVNAEKLAALGQLIAGIAHEVNTPLGAINASNSNIQSSFDLLIENIEENIIKFSPKEIALLKQLMANYKGNHVTQLISRDKRRIKREISERLTREGNPYGDSIADIIVYINQHDHVESILKEGTGIDLLAVLKAAKNLISLIKNSENIGIATDKASQVVLALKKYIHKTPDGNKSQTDIVDNIETVLTLNYNKIKQGIEIIKNYETIPFIYTYPDEISQVWNNLVTNAIHAMNNKGSITIDILNKKDTVVIKFTDTGSGIPEDIREKIFTPFFTTKSSGEGTGLGLDIVKRIVDKHNGLLTLESEINKGTTFSIELPKN